MSLFTGGLLALSAGSAAYSAFGPRSSPNFGNLDALYSLRRKEIGAFADQLTAARQKYLTSLGNMYDKAYARFSGNAEAGFASRGLAVNGGAFASALARKTADYQAELEPLAFQAEREDLARIDSAYAGAAGMNATGRAEQGIEAFRAGRSDSAALGRFVGDLTSYGLSDGFSSEPARTGTIRNGQVSWDNPAPWRRPTRSLFS